MTEKELRSQQRMGVILQVVSGQITATEGARQLGVSRKTYYQWEKRGMASLAQALEDQPTGRPAEPSDPEKEHLCQQVEELQQKLHILEQAQVIRERLRAPETGAQKK